jgi:hypothetical protein
MIRPRAALTTLRNDIQATISEYETCFAIAVGKAKIEFVSMILFCLRWCWRRTASTTLVQCSSCCVDHVPVTLFP